jgi:hypothetical protein
MSYSRGPRKRSRGGTPSIYVADIDYYDGGGDRYNRPRLSVEDSVLTRLHKDFVALADLVQFYKTTLI